MPTWLRVVLVVLAVATAVGRAVQGHDPLVRRLTRGLRGRVGRLALRLLGLYALVLVAAAVAGGICAVAWSLSPELGRVLCVVAVAALGPFCLVFVYMSEYGPYHVNITHEIRKAGTSRGQAWLVALLGAALCFVTMMAVFPFGIVVLAVD